MSQPEQFSFIPRNLAHMFGDPYGEKKLRKREGFVQAYSPDGELVWQFEELVVKAYREALKYAASHPQDRIVITESICGQSGIPQRLQISK